MTGGTGFVGQAVLDAVARKNLSVRSLARKIPADRDDAEWVQGALDDGDALAKLVDGADAVIHIAGLTNTPDPARFDAANVEGTANVIASAKDAGIKRFVFVSSLSAREPQLSRYGASKARAEALVQASGLDWTIIRPPAVYGPRDDDMFELFKAARLGIIPMPPGGATSIIHVDDLAELLLAMAASNPATRRKMFEPDDGREGGWSHKELGRAIGVAMGRNPLVPNLPGWMLGLAAGCDRLLRGDKAKLTPDRVGYMMHPNWVARSAKAVPAKIWQPRIAGEDGLHSTAGWYRNNGWL